MIERLRNWRAAAAAVALLAAGARAEGPALTAAGARFRSDIGFLAADAREGRSPGSAGIEAAAAYVAGVFEGAGLKPAAGADGYFQPFSISGSAKLVKPSELSFAGPGGAAVAAGAADFSPLAIGSGGTLDGVPVVFAGFGITADDPARKLAYDDYGGADVKGKLVLILRGEPQEDREDSPFDGKRTSDFATFRHKATNAFQHGAAGLLIVNNHNTLKKGSDTLAGFSQAGNDLNSPIPVAMVTRDLAEKLLTAAGAPGLDRIEAEIDERLRPKTFPLADWTARAKVVIERTLTETRNVVGVLEGSGPLAKETVVVGAHYDHLGRGGGLFSGSLAPFSRDVHNGADDNASGTSMLLEMARRLARRGDPLPRRVVFVAFSGEEKGLLGSQHYVDHPLVPLADTVAMVNFDMVGRLNEKDELTVYGTGTSPGFATLVDALGTSGGFTIKKMADGLGPSDQQSFYLKNLPVLFLFTGTHSDYHRPSDDVNRINFGGMSRIADLAEVLLLDLARRPSKPAFVAVRSKSKGGGSSDPGRYAVKVYFGSIPDYNEDVKGVKLNGVREGSPAEKGGLRKDDVIVRFAGKPVATIYDYTECLSRAKPDETVEVVVVRGGKEVPLKVTLVRRPSE